MSQALDESDLDTSAARRVSRGRLWSYLLPFLVFPILFLVLACIIVPSRWFALHSGNSYMVNDGFATELTGTRCDILVYGDSTAMVAVNPRIVQARTGLRTCNIAEFRGMTVVNGTWLVDTFLAHNPPPRFLVFMFTPENLQVPRDWTSTNTFEAITFRMHARPGAETLLTMLAHPDAFLRWSEEGLRMSLTRVHSQPLAPAQVDTRPATGGQFPLAGPPETQCEQTRRAGDPNPAYVAALRSRYSTPQTTVLIDATPTAACDPGLAFYNRVLPGLVDDIPYPTYPIGVFIKDNRLHMGPEGAALLSNMLADQILQRTHPGNQTASRQAFLR